MNTVNVGRAFHQGDEVILARGTYQGTPGVFLRLRDDINWADIAEAGGRIRIHPVAWLAHAAVIVTAGVDATAAQAHWKSPDRARWVRLKRRQDEYPTLI